MLIPAYEITASNGQLVFNEGSVAFGVQLDPGIYYAYKNELGSQWPSLYDELEAKLNTVASGTYYLSADRPVQSSLLDDAGISIVRDDGANQLTLMTDFGDFDYRFLGFNPNTGDKVMTGDELFGDYTRYGVWQPLEHSSPKVDGDELKDQRRNKAKRPNSVVTRWGANEIRILRWGWVPAGLVRPYINERADFAEAAGLAQHDHGNYWHDLWSLGISTYRDIIRLEEFPGDLRVDTHAFEVLYSPASSEYADKFSSTYSERDEAAHVYRTEVALGRIPADDDQVSGFANYIRAL